MPTAVARSEAQAARVEGWTISSSMISTSGRRRRASERAVRSTISRIEGSGTAPVIAIVTGYVESMQRQAATPERTGTALDDPIPF